MYSDSSRRAGQQAVRSEQLHKPLRTDAQHAARTAAQGMLHRRAEFVQLLIRHEHKRRTGKSAAMDTVCTPTAQRTAAEGKRQRKRLIPRCAARCDILQEERGGIARIAHKT